MLDTTKIPKHTLGGICLQLGWDGKGEIPQEYLTQVSRMNVRVAFDRWLTHNGLIGWAGSILDTIEALQKAEQD